MGNQKKCKAALEKLCDENAWGGQTCRSDLVIFDVLRHKGAYFPSMHTDTEWNKVDNDGFQVWCLEYNKNKNKIGNMFIFENMYLENKYKHMKYFLRPGKNGGILVVKNCTLAESVITGKIKQQYVMEEMTREQFVNTTKKYYLDFEAGDCMAFDSNLLHMSDYRDRGNMRQSFNFRVALKNNKGELKLNPLGCGYVNSLSSTLKNPGMYSLVTD